MLQDSNEGFLGGATVLHLNHEQPWQLNDTTSPDFIFTSINALKESYRKQKLVIRNYFYELLIDSSFYFPVGPSMYGTVLANSSSQIDFQTPASQRKHLCQFKGRQTYEYALAHEHAWERDELFRLAQRGEVGECVVVPIDVFTLREGNYQLESNYTRYIQDLANTAYIPCPAGNNPETFRLYEALEVGAIPLFIQPVWDKNFLRFGLWKDYPGPIFTTWMDLSTFLNSITPEITDMLQERVVTWYSAFKEDVQNKLAKTVDDIFTPTFMSETKLPLLAAHERYKSSLPYSEIVYSIFTSSKGLNDLIQNINAGRPLALPSNPITPLLDDVTTMSNAETCQTHISENEELKRRIQALEERLGELENMC